MRLRPSDFTLAGLVGFDSAEFEKKLPTGLGGTPPNLDFFATGSAGSVAVESKFSEVLSSKAARFSPSYDTAVSDLAEGPWARLFESLRGNPTRFRFLDAAQLVKHYLGVRYTLGVSGRSTLLYVYWEPVNGSELAQFAKHRSEVREFSETVSGSSVSFAYCTHASLWVEWENSSSRPDLTSYIAALRARYDVRVPARAT